MNNALAKVIPFTGDKPIQPLLSWRLIREGDFNPANQPDKLLILETVGRIDEGNPHGRAVKLAPVPLEVRWGNHSLETPLHGWYVVDEPHSVEEGETSKRVWMGETTLGEMLRGRFVADKGFVEYYVAEEVT